MARYFQPLALQASSYARSIFAAILFFVLVSTGFLVAANQPADLTPRDVDKYMHEMMSMHPTFRNFNQELVQHLLVMFANELDPIKIYFTKQDLENALQPSEKTVKAVLADLKRGKFSFFEELLRSMPEKVARMHSMQARLEAENEQGGKDEAVSSEEKLALSVEEESLLETTQDWPEDTAALYHKVRSIRIAQQKAIRHFENEDQKDRAKKTLEKLQVQYEKQMTPDPATPLFQKTLLTLVMKAFAQSLDSQTAFFSPGEAKQFMMQVQQRLFGIGVLLRDDFDGLTITKIVEGGPAEKSGDIQVNDKIIAIKGEPVIGLGIEEAVELIRGQSGTPVTLTIVRKDANGQPIPRDITLLRGEIIIEEERFQTTVEPYNDGVMVAIRLHSFYQDDRASSYEDLLGEMVKLHQKHRVKGIVLDLRNNPGGLLVQAVMVSGLFLDRGIVVSVKDDRGDIYHMRNLESQRIWDGPLIVLVNRASASAAEIVAQTLQDWGRAIVVGDDRTFGKGSFQIFTMDTQKESSANPKGEFKITRGRYYTVSGKSPQLVGVLPDIEVPGVYRFRKIGEKFLTYPLSQDTIHPSFIDEFDDLPFYQRPFAHSIYRGGKQEKLVGFNRFTRILQDRSSMRIQGDKEYQKFISKCRSLGDDVPISTLQEQAAWASSSLALQEEPVEKSHEAEKEGQDDETLPDFQLNETWNILRDLIELDSRGAVALREISPLQKEVGQKESLQEVSTP